MALIIHNYMLKKNHNNNRNYSYRIKEYFEKQNDSLCILAKDNNEAKYLFNELKLLIDNDLIQYFPDNELLPYDHFSIPESLVKKRFQIINSNIESKNIVVSSIKNLFERFPSKELFNNPKHSYTKALLSSIPSIDPEKQSKAIELTGEIPSAMNPPSGCVFKTRCPNPGHDCKGGDIEMELIEISPGHWVDQCCVISK